MSRRLCIVCEGYEEFDYIMQIKSLNVWSAEYKIKVKNATSIDKISAVYQNEFQSDSHDLVLVYCDTENPPFDKFETVCRKINRFHDNDIAKEIVFFANPCTMQIILSHFDTVSLKSNQKCDNGAIIRQLTGVKEYIAQRAQRQSIMAKITKSNYRAMCERISKLSNDYKNIPSTNARNLFAGLESDNVEWVDILIDKIDGNNK